MSLVTSLEEQTVKNIMIGFLSHHCGHSQDGVEVHLAMDLHLQIHWHTLAPSLSANHIFMLALQIVEEVGLCIPVVCIHFLSFCKRCATSIRSLTAGSLFL